jgi:hypothetical protein
MASILLLAITVVDILATILFFFPFPGDFMLAVAILLLGKGIWSVISSLNSGFYYDAFGLLDFLGAIVLLIVNFGTPLSFAWMFGALIGLKAVWATLSAI